MSSSGWIGVDLDGTLAEYGGWQGELHIGKPVPIMLDRVKAWRELGVEVRIFTARVAEGAFNLDGSRHSVEHIREAIQTWCEEHVGERLPVTNQKDYAMVELWDDRCVQVIPNTGRRADGA